MINRGVKSLVVSGSGGGGEDGSARGIGGTVTRVLTRLPDNRCLRVATELLLTGGVDEDDLEDVIGEEAICLVMPFLILVGVETAAMPMIFDDRFDNEVKVGLDDEVIDINNEVRRIWALEGTSDFFT